MKPSVISALEEHSMAEEWQAVFLYGTLFIIAAGDSPEPSSAP